MKNQVYRSTVLNEKELKEKSASKYHIFVNLNPKCPKSLIFD